MTSATLSRKKPEQYRAEPSSAQMRKDALAFAAKLRSDPVKAKEFFQRAGILNAKGQLTDPYK
ncbi:hypothetical protein QN372_01470 [Undibacterium sp. RTI2.1]|uniref:hypothetical protein n=1 Tax=unclassified Undibacterium TaxID=2630295 RepID=UPI002B233CAE|nr:MULTISPECIES: hypothetical protein [unclassified Undibacterium]MEB0029408.1 hypothetical protein [Undibacterium sp. RTI2.1]MEB0115973.1 hypothetical protein [Undibacterium sp. RTI2.2]